MIIPDPIAQSRDKLGLDNLHKIGWIKRGTMIIPDPIAQSRDKLGLGNLHKLDGLTIYKMLHKEQPLLQIQ